MDTDLIIVDESIENVISNNIGLDFNYMTFESLYTEFKDIINMEHISLPTFLKILFEVDAIYRTKSKGGNIRQWPQYDVWQKMKENKLTSEDFYCMKYSANSKAHIHSYGIRLDKKDDFIKEYKNDILEYITMISIEFEKLEAKAARRLQEDLDEAETVTERADARAEHADMLKRGKERILNRILTREYNDREESDNN
jgi:hypothetical protein